MTPDQLAPFVGAKTGAEIVAYENDEDDLLVSVLFGYAKLAGVPVETYYTMTTICGWGVVEGAVSEDASVEGGTPPRRPCPDMFDCWS